MYWEEKTVDSVVYKVPEDVIDLVFKIKCKSLPIDHAESLSEQIERYLPWMLTDAGAAIHSIHVAESANGWIRPSGENDIINVSHRTKMTLRIPSERLDDVNALVGQQLDIQGHSLEVGKPTKKVLSKMTTIFARYIDTLGEEDEGVFLQAMQSELKAKGIRIKKMMSGLLVPHKFSDGVRLTRKLMLSDLDVEESVILQEQGLGVALQYGFGIFLPHKGIDAVNKTQDK